MAAAARARFEEALAASSFDDGRVEGLRDVLMALLIERTRRAIRSKWAGCSRDDTTTLERWILRAAGLTPEREICGTDEALLVGEFLPTSFRFGYVTEVARAGFARGRVEATRQSLLTLLSERRLGPSDDARARVAACGELDVLHRWILRATSAASEDDVFAAPAAVEVRAAEEPPSRGEPVPERWPRGILSRAYGRGYSLAREQNIAPPYVHAYAAGYSDRFEEGFVDGRFERARALLLSVLAERGLGPSDDARDRVAACIDLEALERWLLRAISAASEAEVFVG